MKRSLIFTLFFILNVGCMQRRMYLNNLPFEVVANKEIFAHKDEAKEFGIIFGQTLFKENEIVIIPSEDNLSSGFVLGVIISSTQVSDQCIHFLICRKNDPHFSFERIHFQNVGKFPEPIPFIKERIAVVEKPKRQVKYVRR